MNNFYLLRRLFNVLLLVILTTIASKAQPCGIEAKIAINCGTATCGYFADTSGYQPGWIGYKYEWIINNQVPIVQYSVPTLMYDQLAAGFNQLQLIVYGTNPTTNDSCIAEYTNIFQATGNAIYPEFDVTVNGNDVTFSGTYKGGPYFAAPSYIEYNFGDGNASSSNSLVESHTYTNSGLKTVYLTVASTDPVTNQTVSGTYYRTINIGAGASNVEFTAIFDNTICDSISLYTSTTLPFTNGSIIENFAIANNPPVNNVYTHIALAEVPGHDFIRVEAYGSGIGEDYNHHVVKVNDCGIIPDTISGTVFEDLNYNGLREPGEPAIAGKFVYVTSSCYATYSATQAASYGTYTDTAGYYKLLVPHYAVNVNVEMVNGYTLTYPQTSTYAVNFNTGTLHTGYNFGLSALSVNICGRAYLDDNNDSLYTFTDRTLPGVMLTATNTITNLVYHTYSGTNGNYCFDLPPGDFVIRPVNYPLDSASFVPDSIIVNAGGGGSFNNRNFGFRSIVPTDFNLALTSSSEARPGFGYDLSTRIRNTGFIKGKGDVVYTYDPLLTPLSVNPANGIINTVAHTVTWTTDSLSPGTVVHYTASFTIPAITPLGTILTNSSTITALSGTLETDLTDNSYTRTQTVIGSFDPNDKAVFPAGLGATGDVLHDTPFDYSIRFQNTGTASAINVFVADTIDEDLDLNTLVIHRASHNYDLVINGNVLTWRFFNIYLPDSNTNEPASHGFIEYSISPKAGLTDGTTIENTAYIYFDFNAPVVTNTTLNTMLSSLASIEEIPSTQKLLAYPNPGSTKIFLLPRVEINGRTEILLFDITGKQVQRIYNGIYTKGQTIEADVEDLAKGMYMIEMRYNGGTENIKWIKQ